MSAAYPPSTAWDSARARPPSGVTAETLVLIGLILQAIGGALVIGGIAWFFGYSAFHPFPYVWAVVTAAAVVVVAVVIFLYFAYTLSYERIRRGEYRAAQAPTLVLGILSLFLGLIPGILYLVGYAKLDAAIREQQGGLGGGPGAVPTALIACRGCGRVHPVGAYVHCPECGQKLSA